jgi:hypothetical protein
MTCQPGQVDLPIVFANRDPSRTRIALNIFPCPLIDLLNRIPA